MKFRALMIVALLLATLPGFSASSQNGANFTYRYDVDSATLTYCRLEGAANNPYGGAKRGTGTIKTSGSSTTVTENVASDAPFNDVAVGDVIMVNRVGTANGFTTDIVVVTAKASSASITVDPAVDWSTGYIWSYYTLKCGTTDADGWIDVANGIAASLTVNYEQGDLDGLRVQFQCKPLGLGALPVIVYPGKSSDCGLGGTLSTDRCNFATAGANARLTVVVDTNVFAACRVGLAYASTDTSDAGANLERVTATVTKVEF